MNFLTWNERFFGVGSENNLFSLEQETVQAGEQSLIVLSAEAPQTEPVSVVLDASAPGLAAELEFIFDTLNVDL